MTSEIRPGSTAFGLRVSSFHARLAAVSLLLATMLFALWYDYYVARVAVLAAYEQISQKNVEMNRASGRTSMVNTDVQAILGKTPSRTFNEGPYRIEVYSWIGGLPFRTHDLYAVYVPRGNDFVFMMEYVYQLPIDELSPRRVKLRPEAGQPALVGNELLSEESADTGLEQGSNEAVKP